MARGGHNKERGDAERKCIVTGEVQPKAGLIRFVVGPENQVYPDIMGKLPGRGMYVTADRAVLEEALLWFLVFHTGPPQASKCC